jgi:putative tryptophan/tyrosine transport system substrate-binding protein
MRRRRLLLASAVLATLPRFAAAQPQARIVRIGWLTAQRPPSLVPYVQAFRTSLAELGFVEGRNLTIDFRYGDDDAGKVRGLAEELMRLPVDLIVVQGEAVLEIKSLKLPVPVVYAYSGDPVVAGLAESLARPNTSMTGLTYLGTELNGKRLELLREIVPGVRRVALLANPAYPGESGERANSEATAGRIGLDVRYVAARTTDDLAAAFARMTSDKVQAISLFADSFAVQNRDRIIAFAMSQRIPLVSSWPVFAESGALCTYGPRLVDSYRRLAYYADRVLRGTPPAELPIEQPTTLETIVNLKTAAALGLKVPEAVLVRADRVIS